MNVITLTPEELAGIIANAVAIALSSRDKKSTGAERQARYRERHKASQTVTGAASAASDASDVTSDACDVTVTPKPSPSPPPSSSLPKPLSPPPTPAPPPAQRASAPVRKEPQKNLIPETFDPQAVEALQRWEAYKKQRGETYKPMGWEALLKQLSAYPTVTIVHAIDNSMRSNYAGLFPEKINQRNGKPAPKPQQPNILEGMKVFKL